MNGFPPAADLWKEARSADGRVYYYNTQTKATQWTKPEVLMAGTELGSLWKEYTAPDGRKYWYNTESKQTTWDMPQVLKNTPAQDQAPARPQQSYVAGGSFGFSSYGQQPDRDRDRDRHRDRDFRDRDFRDRDRERDRDDYGDRERIGTDRQIGFRPAEDLRHPTETDPVYATAEEAENAFMKLLRRSAVQPDWTWEKTMRAIIKDPQYRAIKDAKDRKAAFEKYLVQMHEEERQREKDRQARVRLDFTNMLRTHPEIKYYTRWRTALPIIQGEAIFRSAKNEDERKQLFHDYRIELYRAHIEKEAESRKKATVELIDLLTSLDLEPDTRWSEAQAMIQSNENFQNTEHFKSLNKLDILTAFDNHIKGLERVKNEAVQKDRSAKARLQRQNRDRFIGLLQELKSAGRIRAETKWMDIQPLIEDDPRYVTMLGQSEGSSPLDLFWDALEEEERLLRIKRNDALDVLDDKRYEITPKTTLDEFVQIMQTDSRTANIDPESLKLILDRLRDKVLKRTEKSKHDDERRQRRAIDDLRSAIKHLEPPVKFEDTWEQVRPRLENLAEYRALDSDELRRVAFDKVIRRMKEKDEDHERERRREHRDRERDRYRERDERNGHNRRHRTRTPDPYEADRKKAMEERERQYRKSSMTGLSPPPRWERDGGDSYRGSGRQVSSSHYDRERRERETERERSYVSRADPRDKGSELDYGDSRPASIRRRRDSDAESNGGRRDSKRTRRDRDSRDRTFSPRLPRSKTPQQPEPKPEPVLRAGSEEGEIEED